MPDQQEAHPTFLADPRWHASKTISPHTAPLPSTPGKSRKLPTGGQLRFLLGRLRKAVGERVHTQGGTSSTLLPARAHPDTTWDCQLGHRWMCCEVTLPGKIEYRENMLHHAKHWSGSPTQFQVKSRPAKHKNKTWIHPFGSQNAHIHITGQE